MAGEFEQVFLKLGAGESILVEGNAESGKEFFCRLLLRQALDADFPVAVFSFHPEAHLAWFQEFAAKKAGNVRPAEAPENLTELGIALNEQAKGCRFAYMDFFEVLSAKFEPNDILDALAFNAKKLKAAKTSLLQAVNPESLDAKQMSRLRELFDIVIEVRRKDSLVEYRYKRHPREYDDAWKQFELREASVPAKTLANFCISAMEYELKNVEHYGRSFTRFDDEGKEKLFALSLASMMHFRTVAILLRREVSAAKLPQATREEMLRVLEDGLFEERIMMQKYSDYSEESGDEKAKQIFAKLASEEKEHAEIVENLIKKFSK